MRKGKSGLPACRHSRLTSVIAEWLTQSTGNNTASARLTRPGQQPTTFLDAAIVMQQDRAGALGQDAEMPDLRRPAADIEERRIQRLDPDGGAVGVAGNRHAGFHRFDLAAELGFALFGGGAGSALGSERRTRLGELPLEPLGATVGALEPGFQIGGKRLPGRLAGRFDAERGSVDARLERLVQFPDRRVPRDDRVAQLALLALDFCLKLAVFGFEPAQPPDVGAVRRTDQMRQHVHFREDFAHQRVVGRRMGQRRPVGTRDLAALHRLLP